MNAKFAYWNETSIQRGSLRGCPLIDAVDSSGPRRFGKLVAWSCSTLAQSICLLVFACSVKSAIGTGMR